MFLNLSTAHFNRLYNGLTLPPVLKYKWPPEGMALFYSLVKWRLNKTFLKKRDETFMMPCLIFSSIIGNSVSVSMMFTYTKKAGDLREDSKNSVNVGNWRTLYMPL